MKPYVKITFSGQMGELSDAFKLSLEPVDDYGEKEQAELLTEAKRIEEIFAPLGYRLSKPDYVVGFLKETKGRGCLWIERNAPAH